MFTLGANGSGIDRLVCGFVGLTRKTKPRARQPTGKSAYSTGVLANDDPAKHSVIARIAIEILAETDGPAENNLGGGVSGTDFSLWDLGENWKS